LQEVGESLSLFAQDFNTTHLENLREFNFIDNFYHWFESLDSDEMNATQEVIGEIGDCLTNYYEEEKIATGINAQSLLTEEMVSEFADECFKKELLLEMLETLDMHELE
jgi:hypothetical protein